MLRNTFDDDRNTPGSSARNHGIHRTRYDDISQIYNDDNTPHKIFTEVTHNSPRAATSHSLCVSISKASPPRSFDFPRNPRRIRRDARRFEYRRGDLLRATNNYRPCTVCRPLRGSL